MGQGRYQEVLIRGCANKKVLRESEWDMLQLVPKLRTSAQSAPYSYMRSAESNAIWLTSMVWMMLSPFVSESLLAFTDSI